MEDIWDNRNVSRFSNQVKSLYKAFIVRYLTFMCHFLKNIFVRYKNSISKLVQYIWWNCNKCDDEKKIVFIKYQSSDIWLLTTTKKCSSNYTDKHVSRLLAPDYKTRIFTGPAIQQQFRKNGKIRVPTTMC